MHPIRAAGSSLLPFLPCRGRFAWVRFPYRAQSYFLTIDCYDLDGLFVTAYPAKSREFPGLSLPGCSCPPCPFGVGAALVGALWVSFGCVFASGVFCPPCPLSRWCLWKTARRGCVVPVCGVPGCRLVAGLLIVCAALCGGVADRRCLPALLPCCPLWRWRCGCPGACFRSSWSHIRAGGCLVGCNWECAKTLGALCVGGVPAALVPPSVASGCSSARPHCLSYGGGAGVLGACRCGSAGLGVWVSAVSLPCMMFPAAVFRRVVPISGRRRWWPCVAALLPSGRYLLPHIRAAGGGVGGVPSVSAVFRRCRPFALCNRFLKSDI